MEDNMTKLLEEILTSLKSLDSRIARLEADRTERTGQTGGQNQGEKKFSLREFLIDRRPSNGVQMTLTIGYFLDHHEGISPFNAADIERGFRAAREAVPPNINDKANMCVKNGHFMEHNEKKESMKAWLVTRTGEEVVRDGFGKERP
jgi:hypothetical protein